MGNRLVCCRLKWTSFTNSDEDVSIHPAASRYQFTSNELLSQPIRSPLRSLPFDEECGYKKLLTYCHRSANQYKALVSSVQHISEREPEDGDINPSLNAMCSTLFLQSILTSIDEHPSLQKMLKSANKNKSRSSGKRIGQWSSCGSVYIANGCLSKPDPKLIFHCISVAICSLLKSERRNKAPTKTCKRTFHTISEYHTLVEYPSDQSPSLSSTFDLHKECVISPEFYKEVYELYDERIHPLARASTYSLPNVSDFNLPSDGSLCVGLQFQEQILQFLNRLFSSSLITAESAIVALVYLERLISGLEIHIVAWSWRRQLLSCILLACKVLDDQAVWNADYCQLLKDVQVEDLNELERHTLSLLQFNTGVPPSVYARYYFDLLSVGDCVAFTDLLTQPCRMTVSVARRFRILPASSTARSEHYSTVGEAGGGGFMFDLPYLSPPEPGDHVSIGELHTSMGTLCPNNNNASDDVNDYFCQDSAAEVSLEPNNDDNGLDRKYDVNGAESDALSDYDSSVSDSSAAVSFRAWSEVCPTSPHDDIDPWSTRRPHESIFGFGGLFPQAPGLASRGATQPPLLSTSANSGLIAYSMLQDSGLY